MPIRFQELSLAAQSSYSQLFQTAVEVQSRQLVNGLSGNFISKKVKGNLYWYYRYSDPVDGRVQAYLGPDSDAIQALLAKTSSKEAISGVVALRKQVGVAVVMGLSQINAAQLKPIKRLAEYGFFQAGGLLVGSHAFAAYANMLGIIWSQETLHRTLDVDFAHAGNQVSLLVGDGFKINATTAIESLEEGFLPRLSSSGRSGSWVHPSDPDNVIDFLTTKTNESDAPFEFPPLGIARQPLKFMEFSLENLRQTVLFSQSSSAIVNVPDPARYAIHKLIVYAERVATNPTKAKKDLAQAGALIEVLSRLNSDDLYDAYCNAIQRGRGWKNRLDKACISLEAHCPDLTFKKWLADMAQTREDEADAEGAVESSRDLRIDRIALPKG